MIVATTEVQNNFGKYLKSASEGEDILITSHNRIIAALISYKEYDSRFELHEGISEYVHAGMKVSYQEFLKIAEKSENRYEYIDGQIYMLSSPTYSHQKAVREIYMEFITWFKGKPCEPLASPFDVTLFKGDDGANVVQPDILVFCDKENIDAKGKYMGTPSLVVEVISESTSSKDFVKKLDLYMQSGIREYWIVNPLSKAVNVFVFEDAKIKNMTAFKDLERAESLIFDGLGVHLKNVF